MSRTFHYVYGKDPVYWRPWLREGRGRWLKTRLHKAERAYGRSLCRYGYGKHTVAAERRVIHWARKVEWRGT
jgi:hypothetical protein